MEESEAGIFVDGGRGGGVDQVPGGSDVGVWDIQRLVEVLERTD